MHDTSLKVEMLGTELLLNFSGELSLYTITKLQKKIDTLDTSTIKKLDINLKNTTFLDTAAAIFILNLENKYS